MAERQEQPLDNYRLIQQLSSSEVAEVYLGEHVFLDTLTALKIFQQPLLEQAVPACLREASTIAGLTHPHVVRVIEFGMQADKFVLAMEYAPGGTLRQSYPPGTRLEPALVLTLLKPIASALQYAHNQNIIHGDLKPENILLGADDKILLSDFGIATLLPVQQQQVQSQNATHAYLAPEQYVGSPQRASDQYSLAMMTYEWLHGQLPLPDENTIIDDTFLSAQDTPFDKDGADTFSAINEVLHVALEKDPSQRFGSVRAFITALEQACSASLAETQLIRTTKEPLWPMVLTPASEEMPGWWSQEPDTTRIPAEADAGRADPLPFAAAFSNSGYTVPPVELQVHKNWAKPGIILLILFVIVAGTTTAVFAVGPERVLHVITGNRATPTQLIVNGPSAHPPLVLPTPTDQPTPADQAIPTDQPTPTDQATPTNQATPTPEQQAQSVIESYYTAINNKDYQTAYNLWVNYPGSYQSFAAGFTDLAHDDYQFGGIAQQPDASVQVSLTLVATSTSSQQTTYHGYYTVGQQADGSWKIMAASMA